MAAGVSRVVLAMRDPDPRVAGGGIAQLEAAGIEVISGVCEAEAQALNRSFIQRVQTGRPWGCLLYTSPSPRDLSTSRMPSSA